MAGFCPAVAAAFAETEATAASLAAFIAAGGGVTDDDGVETTVFSVDGFGLGTGVGVGGMVLGDVTGAGASGGFIEMIVAALEAGSCDKTGFEMSCVFGSS